jgi:hypothetical protein
MKKFTIILKWNKIKNRWDCTLKANKKFIMDFPDCGNIHKLSDGGLIKESKNMFKITVERET